MSYLPSYRQQHTEPEVIKQFRQQLPHGVTLENYVVEYGADSYNQAIVKLMLRSYYDTRYNNFQICVDYYVGNDGIDYNAIFVERAMTEIHRQGFGFNNRLSGSNDSLDVVTTARPSLKEEFEQAEPINLPAKLKGMKKDINKLEKTIKNKKLLLLV